MEINEKIIKLKIKEEELKKELAHWESFVPSGNMGKWGRQVKIDKIGAKLKDIQEKIDFHNNLYLSNEIYKQWKKTALD
ncbi:MAG: hypothetical protein RLZZ196_2427 [Bacteroidota bacterium]|jgi:hypothetical protein